MCGIAGYIGPSPPDEARVADALARIRHRGPDDQSARRWTSGHGRHVLLIHGRLSVIDLDPRSNQPFAVGSRWIAYNGELYNYLELRDGLTDLRTRSDTEVLLRVLQRDGWAGLDDCEGMWAFAVYDKDTGELALCRDRFGEKPLLIHRDDRGGLWFGSEAKLVHALLGRVLPPNERTLRRFLVNGYRTLHQAGETFFEGLDELPAGHLLRIGADGCEVLERYWDPGPPDQRPEMTFVDAVAGTRERLLRAVETRLRADVPLAFCMSGGVDSLSLISAARRAFGVDVHGFTIVNSDARYREQDMVDLAVRELGVRHTAIPVTREAFLPRLRDLVRRHDQPVATISYYVHYLLMEAIHAAGYRVSVSGTAADELFSGYYDHHLLYLREAGDEASRLAWEQHVRPVVRNPHLQDPDRFVRDPLFREHLTLGADVFSAALTEPFSEPWRETRYTGDELRNRMLNELFAEVVPVILAEDDLNAMAFSIENRSPFLDRALYEFAASIPTRHLVRDGRAKAVLREAMRGIVPDPVLDNRRKVGFNAPLEDLLDLSDPAVRSQLLADSPIWGLVRREAVSALLERTELPNSQSKFLFSLVCAKLFLEEVCG